MVRPGSCWTLCLRPLVGACLFVVLCGDAHGDEGALRFNRDIRPILSEKCFFCHGPDANQRKGDLRLDVEDIAKQSAIVENAPNESELVRRILSDDPEVRMPPADSGKSLSPEEISILQRWIQQGAAYEGHWAFLPPKRPNLPLVKNEAWARNAIDRFVLARLEAEGLRPTPEADRYTWIRRVSLDLTGLPPAIEEVDAFIKDSTPGAYERVVDRLLSSRRYGEHLARYWMDAARYADTNGYQYDLEREQWAWRDWVIHAFNSNKPFDEFTVEQIAGDLLPSATDQQKLATGFHRNHPITIEGGVIDEEYRTEYVIDRVVTTSTVWLGLTMTCGRCHDHKYDPITQEDFYSFFAFFNNAPERGKSGFDPKLKVVSPLQAEEEQRIKDNLVEAAKHVGSILDDRIDKLNSWEREVANETTARWTVIVPDEYKSLGGAEFALQDDQSILAQGKNPATDVYELVIRPEQPVHAIRIEALRHSSFVNGGTGRSHNANFVLSEFQVESASKDDPSSFAKEKIASAQADYSQNQYPIASAIDGRIDRTGWAVDGNTRHEDRTALFVLSKPLEKADVAAIRVRMHFNWGSNHQIGRFRVAIASHPLKQIPANIVAILSKDPETRSPQQRTRLLAYYGDRFGDASLKKATEKLLSLQAEFESLKSAPATMILTEMDQPRTTRVLFRGEYDKPRQEVQARTPLSLPPMPDSAPKNRLGLAQWLVMQDNPLTARVAVNRHWQRIFGFGIVKTTEDFGSQGAWPTHPELLDWLADEFVQSGWDTKALLRMIVLSATYRQSSALSRDSFARDPENRLLARGPRLRLDAEAIRDSALQVSGLLGDRLGGPSVFPYHPTGLWQELNNRPGYSRTYKQDSGDGLYRRSLYSFWKRTLPPPSMAAFDAPEREFCLVRRSRTNTPLQAFVLLHDPQFVEAARMLAQRMLDSDAASNQERLIRGFRMCLTRPPSDHEVSVLQSLLEERQKRYASDMESANQLLSVGDTPVESSRDIAELAAWTSVARVLLNLSEFITKP